MIKLYFIKVYTAYTVDNICISYELQILSPSVFFTTYEKYTALRCCVLLMTKYDKQVLHESNM